MTDQERINENLQRQIDAQNARIDNVLTKVDIVIAEVQQQREDIRRAQEKHDADMRDMNKKIGRQIRQAQRTNSHHDNRGSRRLRSNSGGSRRIGFYGV